MVPTYCEVFKIEPVLKTILTGSHGHFDSLSSCLSRHSPTNTHGPRGFVPRELK